MKKLLIYACIVSTYSATAQQTEYSLSKAYPVGCSQGITDLGKKVIVENQDLGVKFIHSNLTCSKTVDASLTIDMGGGAKAYYNTKDKKGAVIEGSVVSLFEEKDGKYTVYVLGHTDKKEAKNLDLDSYQRKYTSSFGVFEKEIEKAKKMEQDAKMAANTLPIPNLNLQDEYGVAGVYYFSELSSISSYNKEIDGKSVKAVYMHLDKEDKNTLKLYLTETSYDKYYFDGSRMLKAFKTGNLNTLGLMSADNMNNVTSLRSSLSKLEDGLYLVNRWYWYGTKSGCSEPERRGGTQAELDNNTKKYILLGKDQKRIEELMNNIPELEKLAGEAAVKNCKFSDALEAAEKPMPPASSLNTGSLKTDATSVTKAFAKGRWAQEVQYAYIIGKEWYTYRNKVTGIITGRGIAAVAIMKDTDGTCRWEEISIKQDYNGSSYGSSYFGGESSIIVPTDCATAMKYK